MKASSWQYRHQLCDSEEHKTVEAVNRFAEELHELDTSTSESIIDGIKCIKTGRTVSLGSRRFLSDGDLLSGEDDRSFLVKTDDLIMIISFSSHPTKLPLVGKLRGRDIYLFISPEIYKHEATPCRYFSFGVQ